ncbi:MAG TPA: DNA polymerase III subunit alpha, partial [Alphaproteobacteria bacterium]|nr:DNA polymerase III subunit alpha [Alphaproteobacteria bacterium]
MSFIHLRTHSAYSLAEGALPIKKLVSLAAMHQMPAVGVCDTHNMFGALEFSLSCSDMGIQPLIGCKIRLKLKTEKGQTDFTGFGGVLCQNEQGYLNLLELLSKSYLDSQVVEDAFISLENLLEKNEGLLFLTGGSESLFEELMLKDKALATSYLDLLSKSFEDRLYLEIQRHGLESQEELEKEIIELAFEKNIPLVATNVPFFDTSKKYEAHDALLCISAGRYVDETNRRKLTPQHYFKSVQEMKDLFKDLPEALENTVLIAKRCHFAPKGKKPILPPFQSPSGLSEEQELRLQAHEGLKQRFFQQGIVQTDEYLKRLEYELSIIEKMGFPGYFLIVSDFIQWAKKQSIPVGPGRGSGAGSLVAWALTITDMDPLRFGLIFERFLNPERVSMPDFDVDFCQDRRDEVINYVLKKYGRDHVAHIITFGKLQARAVIRDVGRVLQMPYGQVYRISKLIPNNPANPTTLEQALEIEPALLQAKNEDPQVAKLIEIGIQLEGLYRHASTHAAGVVIGDRPLYQLIPLYKDDKSDLAVTQFNMKYTESAGLVKFDFLGLKTLTVIEKCRQLIEKKGICLDLSTLPLDDKKTFKLLCDLDVVGVFQLESGGMKDVIRRLKPDRFEDLIALVALYRPGPMDDIPRYCACKHGQEEVTYLHPMLEPILSPTYGVMVYQEQVMHIAQVMGGYSLGEADLLRRAMGKKIKSEMDAQQERFVQGAKEKGIKQDIASAVFEAMAKFAGYGFNKSHSAPYALLAYQTAYLKANYPLEFFAASMCYELNNVDKLNIFRQDLLRLDHKLYPPTVNESYAEFSVEKDGIRYALAAIKNVGHQAMLDLVAERQKKGPFKSLESFLQRIDPRAINKRQLEQLIAAGALDSLNDNRALLNTNIEALLKYSQNYKSTQSNSQASLFDDFETSDMLSPLVLKKTPAWGLLERLQHEFNALGFYLEAHPLEVYKDTTDRLGVLKATALQDVNDGTLVRLAGVVIVKLERTSKSG